MTDKKLIGEYLQGNHKILTKLVKRWHKKFCDKAFWVVKNPDLSKDLAQDSWVTIINKLHTLKDPERFQYWALRIVYTKSIDALHKRYIERTRINDLQINEEIDNPIPDHEDKKHKLLQAIKQLSIEKQNVIRLFYVEQYSIKEIGELLDISTGTVKSRLFKAREELKQTIKK